VKVTEARDTHGADVVCTYEARGTVHMQIVIKEIREHIPFSRQSEAVPHVLPTPVRDTFRVSEIKRHTTGCYCSGRRR
jgi:hypothetical protein